MRLVLIGLVAGFFSALLVIVVCLWTYRSRERIAAALPTQDLDFPA